jgi:PTH1 family peptidyl-tRNA hydrolase
MKLIVWLWNPWSQYEKTRHNAWFILIDQLVKYANIPWDRSISSKRKSYIIHDQANSTLRAKPQTFMNRSGYTVWQLAWFYQIKPEHILVIHDDIDLKPWTIEYKQWWWHAWHNGLRDIITVLGTNTFSRIRIGIGRPMEKHLVADYVLSNFSFEEEKNLTDNFMKIQSIVDQRQKNLSS